MGYSGQPMKVVKANRALLKKKRTFKEIREAYIGYAGETKLHFKERTPFEQQKIRDKIIGQAKKDRLQEIRNYLAAFFILCLLIFAGYLFFSS
ncbi:hypothetical protein DKG77_04375 [Flagellimonas aquimarina]|jgi:hypothetical protein|uniref:Uncharacterized protein n=1 Tax=Flagellimonas aquimarina TaxID=2201895 RepID=A0A316L0M9_9FLAO|nr:hypothetical protein [Allomuricauda koreensis]PWL40067.1 hypothetical protein DKG77_04375 [Allomuricauda koreensis]